LQQPDFNETEENAMREQNDRIGEDNVLHNHFTAYLMTAIRNRKINYLRQKFKLQTLELSYEVQAQFIDFPIDDEPLLSLPVIEQLENVWLQQALLEIKEHELYILFARVLHNKPFAEISYEMGFKMKTVTSIYYRLIERLRKELRGDGK